MRNLVAILSGVLGIAVFFAGVLIGYGQLKAEAKNTKEAVSDNKTIFTNKYDKQEEKIEVLQDYSTKQLVLMERI